MENRSQYRNKIVYCLLFFVCVLTACNTTRHLDEGEHLLRKNTIKLETQKGPVRKTDLKDNLERLVVQKPNTYFLGIPYKLILYNLRYKKYERDSTVPNTVERPAIFDSLLLRRSADNMRGYLFNQGYFYAEIRDTVEYKGKKAYPLYEVKTNSNFVINEIYLNVDDSDIKYTIYRSLKETFLKEGTAFTMSLLEQERSRITSYMRELGYYRFSQENIVDFSLDTSKNPFLDINIVVRAEEKNAYKRYRINRVTVYPDYQGRGDATDPTMKEAYVNDVRFRYHNYYIREQVINRLIYLEKGKLYSQSDYEATINRLNQLGVFQSIQLVLPEDTAQTSGSEGLLNVSIRMTPARKFDFTTNLELSTSTIYFFGITPTVSFRNRNVGKGANALTTSISAGIETVYDKQAGGNFFEHISLLTRNYGFNATLDLPKFLVPFKVNATKKNLPRTIIGFGTSLLDRVNYFTLTNTAANLSYNWRETSTNNWEISPAFINVIRLPSVSDSFRNRLENNDFLKNSYRETFIEGENIAFTFSNQADNLGRSYTYARLAAEEAGGLLGGLDNLGVNTITYSQYFKFDFDVRRYIIRRKSQFANRLYGGVGIPYGASPTLPYIKQYFVGGAYSIRGWRIRTLGPGSYVDTAKQTSIYIDRTGDIKLEANSEFRFDVAQFFSGSIKMKGAVFADAGNIWLSKPSAFYPGGEFSFSKLGDDIAISAGAGARFDLVGFLIVRFDVAMPLKRPLSNTSGGWTFNEINFKDGNWRSNNLILNIAIGYPF